MFAPNTQCFIGSWSYNRRIQVRLSGGGPGLEFPNIVQTCYVGGDDDTDALVCLGFSSVCLLMVY